MNEKKAKLKRKAMKEMGLAYKIENVTVRPSLRTIRMRVQAFKQGILDYEQIHAPCFIRRKKLREVENV